MRKLLVILAIFAFTGCAQIQKFASDHIPDIEAKAGGSGIGISIDPKLGINHFCLTEDGGVKGTLDKVPVLGSILVDLLGVCAEEPTVKEAE